jgi:hypothetical protein
MYTVLLPPGVNTTTVNQHIYTTKSQKAYSQLRLSVTLQNRAPKLIMREKKYIFRYKHINRREHSNPFAQCDFDYTQLKFVKLRAEQVRSKDSQVKTQLVLWTFILFYLR